MGDTFPYIRCLQDALNRDSSEVYMGDTFPYMDTQQKHQPHSKCRRWRNGIEPYTTAASRLDHITSTNSTTQLFTCTIRMGRLLLDMDTPNYTFFLVKIVLLSASCRWQDWVLAEWVCQSNPGKISSSFGHFWRWASLYDSRDGVSMNEVPDLSLLKLENTKYYTCTYNNCIHSDSYHTFIHTYILWGYI